MARHGRQHRQQAEFDRRELQRAAFQPRRMAHRVDPQPVRRRRHVRGLFQHGLGHRLLLRLDRIGQRATQHRPHPRHHLARAERLADVVVGAQLQPQQPVNLFDARRHHDDGHRREGADLATDVDAVTARQHQVQQHQIRRVGAHRVDHQPAIGQDPGLETGSIQVSTDQDGQLRLVLDHQQLQRPARIGPDILLRHPFPSEECSGGSSIRTRSPPNGEACAMMRPPCASTMPLQIASPSPDPPVARFRDASRR